MKNGSAGSRLIVITGGIGAGKTTVMRQFAQLGAATADADDIAHELYAPGSALLGEIASHFGKDMVGGDGALDRARLAARVFGDDAELAWLNAQLHPRVQSRLAELAAAAAPAPLLAAVPLWYECGWGRAEAVVAVWCDAETQRQRLLARGWSEEECRRRLAHQLTMDEKVNRADFGILTSCPWAVLEEQCRRLLKFFLGIARF